MDGSIQSHFKVIVAFRSSLFGDLGMTKYGLGAFSGRLRSHFIVTAAFSLSLFQDSGMTDNKLDARLNFVLVG